ncbi:glycosyltransferase family 10, partial [Rickettsiales bacterium]|nr:glycosyltransferase family 10 [Rickettsiales bacterium]
TYWHSARYHFCIALKRHFKDKIDIFGSGHNQINTKTDAILPYKYHIAIENQSLYNVITEKLYDPFLGLAYPIYFGAPNIEQFFHKNSLTNINIFDFKSSVETIESVISSNLWEENQQYLIESKNKVLDDYSIFARIAKICDLHPSDIDNKDNVTLYPRSNFKKKRKYNTLTKHLNKFFKN